MWRRRLRELTTWSILAIVLGALVTFVWFTHHPGSPVLARAAGWPLVGPWVERFRVHYGVGAVAAGGGTAGGEAGEPIDASAGPGSLPPGLEPPRRLGAPPPAAEPSLAGRTVHVWASAGDLLRAAPDETAQTVGRLDAFEQLAVLERTGDWVRVESRGATGWLRSGADTGALHPLGSGRVPTTPVPSLTPDQELLAAVRDLFGRAEPVGRLGPYDLYSDLPSLSELTQLDRLASEVEPAYEARYGRRPIDRPREAVLLFADEASYRLFQVREARLAGLPSGGHAGSGMVALFLGDRRRSEVAATFVHELTHVLNRRAVGPVLPPWLDEGLANDLGFSAIGPAGDLDPRRVGGERIERPGAIDYVGAPASLRQLNAAYARERPRLEELTALDWERFVRSESRGLHYAHAGFFIRYLIEGEEGKRAAAFRRFLGGVATGAPATGEALRGELGSGWEELDAGLAAWVRGEIERQANERHSGASDDGAVNGAGEGR